MVLKMCAMRNPRFRHEVRKMRLGCARQSAVSRRFGSLSAHAAALGGASGRRAGCPGRIKGALPPDFQRMKPAVCSFLNRMDAFLRKVCRYLFSFLDLSRQMNETITIVRGWEALFLFG